jgi:ferric-chelate reductase
VTSGLTLAKVIICAGYCGTIVFALFYGVNPFAQTTRFGFVAVAQFPLLYALGTKSNPIGFVIGLGYERVSAHAFTSILSSHHGL